MQTSQTTEKRVMWRAAFGEIVRVEMDADAPGHHLRGMCDSWEAAHEKLLDRANRRLDDCWEAVDEAEQELDRIKALRNPEA